MLPKQFLHHESDLLLLDCCFFNGQKHGFFQIYLQTDGSCNLPAPALAMPLGNGNINVRQHFFPENAVLSFKFSPVKSFYA